MSEKIYKQETESPKIKPRFSPGMCVINKHRLSKPPVVYLLLGPKNGMIELQENSGKVITLDQKYFLDNFEEFKDIPQIIQLEGRAMIVRILDSGLVQLQDIADRSNVRIVTYSSIKSASDLISENTPDIPPPSKTLSPDKKKIEEIQFTQWIPQIRKSNESVDETLLN